MPTDILIRIDRQDYPAQLDESQSPETVRQILDALPIRSSTRTWGDEIYFEIPVQTGEEDAQAQVSKGDLGYWPEGNCFCIFFGRTPMSTSEEEIVPASPVNVVGRIGEIEGLTEHGPDEEVEIRRAEG